MSDTPKTDAAIHDAMTWKPPLGTTLEGESTGWLVVEAEFAQELERALAAARARVTALEAERERLRGIIDMALDNFMLLSLYIANNGDTWVQREASTAMQEIRAALAAQPEEGK